MSGVGHIAEKTQHGRGIIESAIAEATSVRGQVETKVASLAAHTEASMVQVVGTVSECVREVAAHSEAQMPRVIGNIAQRLEKDIEAAAVSVAVMSEQNTRTVVDGLREEVKAQLVQNRADLEHNRRRLSKQWIKYQLIWMN